MYQSRSIERVYTTIVLFPRYSTCTSFLSDCVVNRVGHRIQVYVCDYYTRRYRTDLLVTFTVLPNIIRNVFFRIFSKSHNEPHSG